MQVLRSPYAFDRSDLGELRNVLPARDARADYLAVQYDVAHAALAAVAAALCACHLQLFAKNGQQRHIRFAYNSAGNAVDRKLLNDIASFELVLSHFLCHLKTPLEMICNTEFQNLLVQHCCNISL